MFPLEQGAAEMVMIGVLALIVVGPKDLPVLMRRVGQLMAKMRGLAAEFRASFDEMARQSELDKLRKEVDALRSTASAPLGSLSTDFQAEMDAVNAAYQNPPYGAPSGSAAPPSEPRGFAFPPTPLAYEPPVYDTPALAAETASADTPETELAAASKPRAPRKPRAKTAPDTAKVSELKPEAPRKPRASKTVSSPSAPEPTSESGA